MKLRNFIIPLLLLSTMALGACSAKAATSESMPKVVMATEPMEEENMADEKMDEQMDEDEVTLDEDMAEHPDEKVMEGESEMKSGDEEAMGEEMMEDKDDSMKEDATVADGMMAPDWFKAVLTNTKTGETFTIADFKGKVVLVETLAMWCSNCLKQQGQVAALHDLLGEHEDFISLGIDIDPNENAGALKAYTEKNGFDWLYTVAPVEVAREIGQLYGDQFLNPPSTPMLIIDRNGEVHILPFGIKSTESLLAAIQPFLDE